MFNMPPMNTQKDAGTRQQVSRCRVCMRTGIQTGQANIVTI